MDKILILAGGYSNEREISLITARSVTRELKKNKKYKLLTIEPDGQFVKKLRNTLGAIYPLCELETVANSSGISLDQRPQELSPKAWVTLASHLI